jgi:hypothetical protein
MRFIYTVTLIIVSIILFLGCNQSSDPASPVGDLNLKNANWISLPSSEGMQIENSFSSTKRINGSKGGYLSMNKSYSGGPFGTVTIEAELIFTRRAYRGNKYISMTIDDCECVTTFAPSFKKFKRAVTYSVTYTGIDLSNIDPDNVAFAFIASNGDLEYAQHEGITVNF